MTLAPGIGCFYQAFGADGLPLNAGLIYTYAAGTTNNRATYTSSDGLIANTNPIVLGADGRPPNEIWLIELNSYRFDLKTSAGTLIATFDNIPT